MKVLTFSRLSLVLALALGLMVFWVAATPRVVGARSLTGSWVGTDWPSCCDDITGCSCNEGLWPWNGCDPHAQDCCYWAGHYTSKNCRADLNDHPCQTPPGLLCNQIHNAECD
jgi:hypothetical protein